MRNISEMTLHAMPTTECTSLQVVVRRVAAILLDNAGIDATQKSALSQREMAMQSETSWEQVNKSLRYLHRKGAIRIDRHRIIIRESSLLKIARLTGKTPPEEAVRGG